MSSSVRSVTAFAALLLWSGCDGSSLEVAEGEATPVEQQNALPDQAALIARLDQIESSGVARENLAGLQSAIERLAPEDQKAALLADYQKLAAAPNERAVKSVAKAMKTKLGS